MFVELEPLLAERTLILTLSAGVNGAIRLNVIPKCRKEGDPTEAALATPLSMTGTAAELDRELPGQLAQYTHSILETGSTLRRIQEAHQSALKQVEAENKKALDTKRKTPGSKPAAPEENQPVPETQKPVETQAPAFARVVSLFDDLSEALPAAEAAGPGTPE